MSTVDMLRFMVSVFQCLCVAPCCPVDCKWTAGSGVRGGEERRVKEKKGKGKGKERHINKMRRKIRSGWKTVKETRVSKQVRF